MPEPFARRHVVLGMAVGAAAAGVSGCTADDDGEPSRPPVDADTELVERVAAAVATQRELVHQSVPHLPRMKPELIALRRVHAVHLEALGGYAGGPIDLVVNRQEARAAVLRGEQRLQDRLASAAANAGSGSLAKLLASMSAAVAQQLVVL